MNVTDTHVVIHQQITELKSQVGNIKKIILVGRHVNQNLHEISDKNIQGLVKVLFSASLYSVA